MDARTYLLLAAAMTATGCTDGFKRFAPPGIVKYEDLEKGEPTDPAIAARVEEFKATKAGGFPKLAEQPQAAPKGIAAPERAAMEKGLLALRDDLTVKVEADRAAAAAERDTSIATLAEQLEAAIAEDNAKARAEREAMPPPPEPNE